MRSVRFDVMGVRHLFEPRRVLAACDDGEWLEMMEHLVRGVVPTINGKAVVVSSTKERLWMEFEVEGDDGGFAEFTRAAKLRAAEIRDRAATQAERV